MDSENMQRISLYLDRKLVKRADRFAKEQGFSSRRDMRVLAELSEYTPEQVEEMRRDAINNVRRTRGKVSLEYILAGYYDD